MVDHSRQTLEKTKTFRSLNREELNQLCADIADNIELFLNYFGIEDYSINGNKLVCNCPIHGGDNNTAMNIWLDGEVTKGNWVCHTHGCQENHGKSAVSLIRALLKTHTNCEYEKYPWGRTLDFISGILGKDLSKIDIDRSKIECKEYNRCMDYLTEKPESPKGVERHLVRKTLRIPSHYFVERGFDRVILERYDVGDCTTKGKEMYLRAVAPIYDCSGKIMVGCSGRSFFDKCSKCGMHHHPNGKCPPQSMSAIYCKWKHQNGFKADKWLYNYWSAAQYIEESGWATLVESPGNVWRLEEIGIRNSLGIFGTALKDGQRLLLDRSGALNLLIVPDAGEAGYKSALNLYSQLKNAYKVVIADAWWDDDIAAIKSDENKTRLAKELKEILN